ncbi:DUF4365 domain-containing protein [Variovorax sp. J22G21]|uniref:DUF4365 domain-containing protein n=1 Tax=Variovorax fucosicus TaxID=3053517 RepID=UPI0025757326|nr:MULTISPECIES: DUF4365 domain-containing protein [unclassified Variovorax]MDM0037429.1 DUF4365 domain-containing protein [Variovorax sp. J22R193]MDM0062205.1 DUF4365 domain-containing protein [Variovorax sp. J22G21]
MANRSSSQKTGSQGHKWLLAHVEEHPHWLSRELSEDFGIDAEFEMTEHGLTGDILKVQIKSSDQVERRDGAVKFIIERKYLEYADACRYPFIMVRVDVATKEAWYLWLQDWLLAQRVTGSPLLTDQEVWTEWVSEVQTIRAGLEGELKSIARWEGSSQLALSLRDAMHAATAVGDRRMMLLLADALASCADGLGQAGLNAVIDEAIKLGNLMRGTHEGNLIADQLFAMVRRHGPRIDAKTIDRLILRGNWYSRAGLSSLAILYDEHFTHISSLGLPARYADVEARVSYYCAFREAHPEHKSADVFVDPSSFVFAGLRYLQPDMFWDKYANHGPSALLDHLEPVEVALVAPVAP